MSMSEYVSYGCSVSTVDPRREIWQIKCRDCGYSLEYYK